MPGKNSITTSVVLSNVVSEYPDQSFISEQVSPTVLVNEPMAKIYSRGKEKIRPHDDIWTSGKAALVDLEYGGVSYETAQHKLATELKRGTLNNADNPLDLREDSASILTGIILLNKEKRVQAISQGSGSITNTLAASIKWNAAGTTPREDVNDVKGQVRGKIGANPNIMVASVDVRNAMIAFFLGEAQITYGESAKTVELPDVVFGMKPVIPMCVENTANINQAASISDVWTNVMLLVKSDKPSTHYNGAFCSPRRKNFNGDTTTDKGWRVRRIKKEEEEIEKIEVAMEDAELVIDLNGAGTITNIL